MPLPANAPLVPLATVTSCVATPVTGAEKVSVTVKASFVGWVAALVSATVALLASA